MTRELIVGTPIYFTKVTLSTWDDEIDLSRIDVDLQVPDQHAIDRLDDYGRGQLINWMKARPENKK